MDYYPLGDMVPSKVRGSDMCVTALGQMLGGLNCLHQKNILHLDLKPTNILVAGGPHLKFMISNFGIAQQITETSMPTPFAGTYR